MRYVYTPEGAEPQSWEYDASRLLSPEAEAIERHTGWTFEEWQAQLGRGSMLAHHGLLFVLLKRSRPTLKWDEVVFSYSEVDFELDEDETREAIAALEAEPELSEREQAALDLLRGTLDEAPKASDEALELSDENAISGS